MDNDQTCGKGLAEHSVIPTRLSELIGAMADNLEAHLGTLDLTDELSTREFEAYKNLVTQQRSIAAQLQELGGEMASHRDLPMGRHDELAMADPKLIDAFVAFVRCEREVIALLEESLADHREMLSAMGFQQN